jgi:hypothetical protein
LNFFWFEIEKLQKVAVTKIDLHGKKGLRA